MGTLANSEAPDEMQHNAAFHEGLHCLLRLKYSSGTEVYNSLENSTCDPLKYTVDSLILIVSQRPRYAFWSIGYLRNLVILNCVLAKTIAYFHICLRHVFFL